MTSDRREPRLAPPALNVGVALAWLVVTTILLAGTLSAIAHRQFADPDDTLRLIEVRDLLGGQGWFDLHQYRVNPPAGVLMHWSRLVDAPLATIILALRPLVGVAGAELAACVAVPLLTLAAAQWLAARIAYRQLGGSYVFQVGLLWALMLPTIAQLQPMRIDHHGWQIVAVLAALNGLLARDPRKGGWIAGVSLACGMSISLELLPFTALFAGVFGLRWLGESRSRVGVVAMLQSLAAGSVGLFLATRGFADLANHCDTVSPAYILGFVAAAGLVTAISVRPPVSRPMLLMALAAAGVASAAVFLLAAPACIHGPFATLDPLVRSVWYANVLEGMPVWRQPWANMLEMVAPPLLGLFATAQLFARERQWKRRFWLEYGLLLGGSLAISIMVARFAGVACAIATVPLGWQLREWLKRAQDMPNPAVKVLTLAAMLAVLMPGLLVVGVQNAFAAIRPSAAVESANDTASATACGLPDSVRVLSNLPRATVFAPIDIGPDILIETGDTVVATAHHRGAAGIHDVIAAFLAPPDRARAIILRHGAHYVVSCSGVTEAKNYKAVAPAGLMARLIADKPPTWLTPVALPAGTGTLRVWKVAG